jgi:hypothetical protein
MLLWEQTKEVLTLEKKDDIERYADAQETSGLPFAIGMPMTIFRLISNRIREFTQ